MKDVKLMKQMRDLKRTQGGEFLKIEIPKSFVDESVKERVDKRIDGEVEKVLQNQLTTAQVLDIVNEELSKIEIKKEIINKIVEIREKPIHTTTVIREPEKVIEKVVEVIYKEIDLKDEKLIKLIEEILSKLYTVKNGSSDWNSITGKPLTFPPSNHNHNDTYYTKEEVDNMVSGADEYVEYADLASFPVTGESGKIYIDLSENKTYRWTGSTYVQVGGSGGDVSTKVDKDVLDGDRASEQIRLLSQGNFYNEIDADTDTLETVIGKLDNKLNEHQGQFDSLGNDYQLTSEKNIPNGYAGIKELGDARKRIWSNDTTPEDQLDGIHIRSADPTTAEDTTAGYATHDKWINTGVTPRTMFYCDDSDSGTWSQIGGATAEIIRNQTSDISSNSLTLLDTQLTFPVEANSVYRLDGWLVGGGNSSGGIRIILSLPAGCTGRHGLSIATTNINVDITAQISPFAQANNMNHSRYNGTLITGGNAGTVTLQFSSANAGQTGWFRTHSILNVTKK